MLDIKGFMFSFTPNITLLSLMSRRAWLSHAWTLAGGRGHRHHSIRRHSILCLRRDIWRWWSKELQSSCFDTPLMSLYLAGLQTEFSGNWNSPPLSFPEDGKLHTEKYPHPALASNHPLQKASQCDTEWSKCNGRGQTSQDCRPESRDPNHKSLASLGNCTSGRREPCLLHHGTRQRRNGP